MKSVFAVFVVVVLVAQCAALRRAAFVALDQLRQDLCDVVDAANN